MATAWSHDKIMQLIELFQSRPLLWDSSTDEYKDKNKKNDAWEEISQTLNVSRKDVETKVHVLRSQFAREKKRMLAKKTSIGAKIQKCKWVFYEPLQFLLNVVTRSGDLDAVDKTVNEDSVTLHEYKVHPLPSSTPTQNASTSTLTARKRNNTDSCSEIHQVCANKKMKVNKDEFDIYGAYIASELRTVKDDKAVTQAKYFINNILLNLKMGKYNTRVYQNESNNLPIDLQDETEDIKIGDYLSG
ncbi:hypothetical protein K1T71_010799 [Dendrolimus kikuchii]|uniref:Uncharacterized protein n=1 Tax=Dendrolimus kikuchii TaxID=765133 RepID=A0ACC1CQ71_9NEOP|nr:hypothetical protein K1T71_010799 [Dendrolimus kikuchii]